MRTLVVSNIMSVDGCYEGPGRNMPLVDSAVDLDLLEVRRFDGSSNVLLRYAVRRDASAVTAPAA